MPPPRFPYALLVLIVELLMVMEGALVAAMPPPCESMSVLALIVQESSSREPTTCMPLKLPPVMVSPFNMEVVVTLKTDVRALVCLTVTEPTDVASIVRDFTVPLIDKAPLVNVMVAFVREDAKSTV